MIVDISATDAEVSCMDLLSAATLRPAVTIVTKWVICVQSVSQQRKIFLDHPSTRNIQVVLKGVVRPLGPG